MCIMCIEDTYVVCKYVQKTYDIRHTTYNIVLELGFIVHSTYTYLQPAVYTRIPTWSGRTYRRDRRPAMCYSVIE
jgi:hypothetical protein